MRILAALAAAALHLCGCALMPNHHAQAREAWQGATYEEVVARWGAPLRSTSSNDGRLVHTWFSEGMVPRTSVWPSLGISAGSGMGVGIGVGVTAGASREVPVRCDRTLIFKDERVAEQTWQGPADFCDTFRRN
jgi:hypothetical protein